MNSKLESTILKMRGHLSILFPAASKRPKPQGVLHDAATILFDWCSRKKVVPPHDEWPAEISEGLKRALVECDGDFFRAMAAAADAMKKPRSSHAEHVSTMIYFAANHLGKTGEKPSKQQLIEGTHNLMVKMGKSAMAEELPQLWTPVIASAGFAGSDKAKSKGTRKNHSKWNSGK